MYLMKILFILITSLMMVITVIQWLHVILLHVLFKIQVAKDPSGANINALEQHIKNLLSPSTPLFFNTLYDPYREGADFVRGYPFSLREGVPTAISHGLWLNIPDYDAPTQLVKPAERNTRYMSFWAMAELCIILLSLHTYD